MFLVPKKLVGTDLWTPYLGALKKMVVDGILVKVKDSYKISAKYKKKEGSQEEDRP